MSNTEVQDQQDIQFHENQPIDDGQVGPPEYCLNISKDRVSVLVDCPNPHNDTNNLVQRILADFNSMEIPEFPDAEILTSILTSSCKPGQDLRDHTIIMGQTVSPSINGSLEWARDFFAEGWEVDKETGAIDFWAKCESRSVVAGELLVTLHHPIDGVPGLNVFGNEIPVSKPTKVKLRSGKNTTMDEEDGLVIFKAACDGRVRFADGTVSVDDVYIITGNVSLETGNIVHAGAVMIQGDVGAGATLEVEGDIIVKGMLEPCNIKCGGSLTVAGGIVGEEGHSIELGGDLVARYISEAFIEVTGDVLVGNEVSHSQILCLGRVKIPKGRIAGGKTLALKGIRVSEAGASGSSDTHLVAGTDYTLRDKVRWHNEKVIKLEEAQDKIQGALEQGQRKRKPSGEEIKSFEYFKRKIATIAQAIADELMVIQKLKVTAAESAVEEVLITKELWSGTIIQLGKDKTTVRSSVLKPRIAQRRKRKVVIGPLGDGNMPDD